MQGHPNTDIDFYPDLINSLENVNEDVYLKVHGSIAEVRKGLAMGVWSVQQAAVP